MMDVRTIAPHPALAPFVRNYALRTAELGGDAVRIALPARTQAILEFYFATPHLVELQRTTLRERAPWNVAVGPQTYRRVDLILSGRIDVFTIAFTATGMHALFGVPMTELTDAAIEAADLLGCAAARDLHDALAAARPDARAALADAVLLDHIARRDALPDVALVQACVTHLQRSQGRANLAIPSGISDRHFRRQFALQVGMSPKRYARVVRLGAAIAAKARTPERRWTEIAHAFGWFDQAHLDKDFRALAGTSPSAFPFAPQREAMAVSY